MAVLSIWIDAHFEQTFKIRIFTNAIKIITGRRYGRVFGVTAPAEKRNPINKIGAATLVMVINFFFFPGSVILYDNIARTGTAAIHAQKKIQFCELI